MPPEEEDTAAAVAVVVDDNDDDIVDNSANNDAAAAAVREDGDLEEDVSAAMRHLLHLAAHGESLKQQLHDAASIGNNNSSIGMDYTMLTKLNVSNCGLSEFPSDLSTALPNLKILFASQNHFTEMPAFLGDCLNLTMIALKSQSPPLTKIHPNALQPQLQWLILTDNQLTELPSTIGRCQKLQKCMLSGNAITSLPSEMSHCTSLELIRLASNQLASPPSVIMKLPRITWMGLSENPFLMKKKIRMTKDEESLNNNNLPILHDLTADRVAQGTILGQGAGGITRRVEYMYTNHHHHNYSFVAVKSFGGTMTSDGSPTSERHLACLTATLQLPALVQVYGQTAPAVLAASSGGAGAGGGGDLVMEYLHNYRALAGPPSMDTCTRDVYPENDDSTKWTCAQAEAVVTCLLETLVGLHRAGITHGDFYSHNILVSNDENNNDNVDSTPSVRLTDFGAAYVYDRNADYAKYIERAELRAFGIWVNEVNQHCLVDSSSSIKLNQLAMWALQEDHTDGKSKMDTFEQVHIAWRKLQLAAMAKAFCPEEDFVQEEKEID